MNEGRPMTPHHCRYCGKLLETWDDREDHIAWRAARGGQCAPTPSIELTDEEARRRSALERTFDMRKMRERLARARTAN